MFFLLITVIITYKTMCLMGLIYVFCLIIFNCKIVCVITLNLTMVICKIQVSSNINVKRDC